MQFLRRFGFMGWSSLVVATLLVSLSVVHAGDEPAANDMGIEAGLKAVEAKDYARAFGLFVPLAEAGNAEAQHNLGMLYRTGKGTAKDLAASYTWFRRAADQGVPDAQYYLGYMYDTGEGVEANPQYAYVWYRKAAEHGHGLAQINLGFLYANGLGVAQDIEQAYLWFHVAAAQGYKTAFENKNLIEEALKEQENGAAMLDALKQRGREYFQQYVMPFGRAPATHGSFREPLVPEGSSH
ncbi:MAG: tetratricopeptide repeat protein [Gammaproteobacteria bacterium]|nr:tetratricopeptide repeat protein [Gammaproteobacteria bacterium]